MKDIKNTHTICSICKTEGLSGTFSENYVCSNCWGLGLQKTENKKEEIRKFESGAVRGLGGKFDFPEYLSPYLIFRFGEHMRKNAVKYGAGNWKKRNKDGTTGIPREEYFKSLFRHFMMLFMEEAEGIKLEPETDHLASLIFNIQGLIVHEEEVKYKNEKEMYGYPFQKLDKE